MEKGLRHDLISQANETSTAVQKRISELLYEDMTKADIKEAIRPTNELMQKVFDATFEQNFSEAFTSL